MRRGVFSSSSRLEAVNWQIAILCVLEITLRTAGVYRQYINSIHPRSIKKNERYSDDGNLGRPLWERQFASATAEGKFEASPPQFFGKGILLQNRDQYLI